MTKVEWLLYLDNGAEIKVTYSNSEKDADWGEEYDDMMQAWESGKIWDGGNNWSYLSIWYRGNVLHYVDMKRVVGMVSF